MNAKRILVIDNEDGHCEFLRILLEQERHIVETANRIRRGIRLFEARQADIIIVSADLPEGLLSALAVLYTHTAGTPVIVTGADVPSNTEARALAAGATAYLAKPLEPEAVLEAVNAIPPRV